MMTRAPEVQQSTREEQIQHSRELACRCAQIADEYRGQDPVVLDLTELTPIVDFFVITAGTSKRQMKAIANEVHRVMKEAGETRLSFEGHDSDKWVLQDYGDIVLHIFNDESRKLYDLEHIWADAKRVDWK